MLKQAVAQPRSGAALRAVPHVQRRCLSSSYLPPAHSANAALTRFFSSLSLPPSLSSLQRCSDSTPHSASSMRSPTCTCIAHTDLPAGCSVGLVQIHHLPLLPLPRGFSRGGGRGGRGGGRAPLNKEGGWCKLRYCQGGDLAREPAAPARPPMSLEVQPWPPHGAAHFPLGCGVAIFVAQG